MRSSMENGYEKKTVYLELLNFYTPFGWCPTEPITKKPSSPINKIYDGGNPFSIEREFNYFEDDIDFSKKIQEKVEVERNNKYALNLRLQGEEVWFKFWICRKYRWFGHRKKLVLKHRCRPIWGSIWALLFVFFTVVLTAMLCAVSTESGAFITAFQKVYTAMVVPVTDFLAVFNFGAKLKTTEYEFIKIFSACGTGVFGFLFIRQCFESWRNQFITRQLLTSCVNALNITTTMRRTDSSLRKDALMHRQMLVYERREDDANMEIMPPVPPIPMPDYRSISFYNPSDSIGNVPPGMYK